MEVNLCTCARTNLNQWHLYAWLHSHAHTHTHTHTQSLSEGLFHYYHNLEVTKTMILYHTI